MKLHALAGGLEGAIVIQVPFEGDACPFGVGTGRGKGDRSAFGDAVGSTGIRDGRVIDQVQSDTTAS